MRYLSLAYVFVGMMVIVSAAFNFSFGWRLGEHSYTVTQFVHDGWIYGALSLAGDGFKVVMGVLTLNFFMARNLSIGWRGLGFVTCGALFLCATLYSLNSAFGSISMNRTDMAGVREAKATNYEAAKIELERVQKELSWLDQGYRAIPAVEADLAGLRQDRLWSRTASCTDATVPESVSFCQRYARYQAELGTARRADELDQRERQLRQSLAGLGGAIIADPHAKMLNQLTGYDQPTIVLAWLLLIVALVEGGSTLGPIALSMAHRAIKSREEASGAAKAPLATTTPADVPSPVLAPSLRVELPPRRPMVAFEKLTGVKSAIPGVTPAIFTDEPTGPLLGTPPTDDDGPGTPMSPTSDIEQTSPEGDSDQDPTNVVPLRSQHSFLAEARITKAERREQRKKNQTGKKHKPHGLVGQWVRDCGIRKDQLAEPMTFQEVEAHYRDWCGDRYVKQPANTLARQIRKEIGLPHSRQAGQRNGKSAHYHIRIEPPMAQKKVRAA